MSLAAAGRAAHERLMTDEVLIERVTYGPLDPATGKRAAIREGIYRGAARIKLAPLAQAQAGERSQPVTRPVLMLPASVTADIRARDTAEVITSLNQAIRGRRYAVAGEESGSTTTARRLILEDA